MSAIDKIIKTTVSIAAAAGATELATKAVQFVKDATANNTETNNGIKKGNTIQILNDTFDLSEIRYYYLENREFIYLPVYEEIETESSILHIHRNEYHFANRYYPYASILSERTKRLNFGLDKSDSAAVSITKNILQATSDVVCEIKDKVESSSQSGQIVNCIDQDGRRFRVDLNTLPNRIIRNGEEITIDCIDGKLVNSREVEISSVPCLIIEADKYYYYFGNGINYEDVNIMYHLLDERIKEALANSEPANQEKKDESEPQDSIEERLKKVKTLYQNNLIDKEEYNRKVQEIMKEI